MQIWRKAEMVQYSRVQRVLICRISTLLLFFYFANGERLGAKYACGLT